MKVSIEEMHELKGFSEPVWSLGELIEEREMPVRKLFSHAPLNSLINKDTTKELINVMKEESE